MLLRLFRAVQDDAEFGAEQVSVGDAGLVTKTPTEFEGRRAFGFGPIKLTQHHAA